MQGRLSSILEYEFEQDNGFFGKWGIGDRQDHQEMERSNQVFSKKDCVLMMSFVNIKRQLELATIEYEGNVLSFLLPSLWRNHSYM